MYNLSLVDDGSGWCLFVVVLLVEDERSSIKQKEPPSPQVDMAELGRKGDEKTSFLCPSELVFSS